MPGDLDNLGKKVDKIIDAVQAQSIKIGILEGKLDEAIVAWKGYREIKARGLGDYKT